MEFIEAKKVRKSCVYRLVFPDGMSYVGKTKDLGSRMGLYERFSDSCNEYLRKMFSDYGFDSVSVDILSEVNARDRVDLELCLSILEIKYIRELKTLYPNGLNISLGGEVLGIPVESITTDAGYVKSYSVNSKSLLVYDLSGDFVEEYPSISRFSYDKGLDEDLVRGAINKQTPLKNKWYIRTKRYDYAPLKIEVSPVVPVVIKERVKYKDVIKENIIEKTREVYRYVPALKYDMNGKFCGEYPTKIAACRTFLKNTTCNWAEYRNGYILFKKMGDDYPQEIEPYYMLNKKVLQDYYVPAEELPDKDFLDTFKDMNDNVHPLCVDGKYTNIKHQFRVGQYKPNGELVATFDSIRDASHETGIRYSQIYSCVKGTTKKAQGFIWKKLDD